MVGPVTVLSSTMVFVLFAQALIIKLPSCPALPGLIIPAALIVQSPATLVDVTASCMFY